MKSSRTGDELNSKCTELKIPCACANHVITEAASLARAFSRDSFHSPK